MKPFLTITEALSGDARGDSPLSDPRLGVVFPRGTSRDVAEDRGPVSTSRRDVWTAGRDGDILDRVFGRSGSKGTYSPREAYGLSPWMQPAIHAFAGHVAARTFRVWQGKKQLDSHWLLDLIARPNSTLRMSESDLFYFTAALWRYDGEVFWQIERGADPKPGKVRSAKSAPKAIWIWNKTAVRPAHDSRTREFIGWEVTYDGRTTFVDRLDMVHFSLFDPRHHNPLGPSRGSSLWEGKKLPLTNEIESHLWNHDFWGRGVAPSVAFIDKNSTTSDDAAEEQQFIDKLKAKVAGKNGEPIYLGGEWVIQQLEASHRDAQFIEGLELNRKAIIAGNTPPIVLGDSEANYANANAQIKAWLTFDVIPAMRFFCSRIDTAFVYDEPATWTELSVDDIDELQEGQAARIDKYIALIGARHSPKAAAKIAGIDVDPTMPGYEQVFVTLSQIPIEDVLSGNVDAGTPPASTVPLEHQAPAPTVTITDPQPETPPAVEPPAPKPEPRSIRVLVNDPAPVLTRADDPKDALLKEILAIVERDAKKLESRVLQYASAAYEAGAKQIAGALDSKTIIAIDNPRVVAFLEKRGNLITSVPQGVAERITNKVTSLIGQGTTPEDIGTIIRKDFNDLSGYKAKQIARQEVGSALNGGRFGQMQEEGIEAREWLSSRDDRVRDSHVAVDGEIVAGLDTKYSNGLLYPQDPEGEPEAVIGCRCVELPASSSSTRAAALSIVMQRMAQREIAFAAENGEEIDARTGYWRAVVKAKDVRTLERQLSDAMKTLIFGWRKPILSLLAEKGITK
jgi:SPP1 gp7 family putative phage head morphogenesis protein